MSQEIECLVGVVEDRYLIEAALGVGAMGAVYRARVNWPKRPKRPWHPWHSFGVMGGAVLAGIALVLVGLGARIDLQMPADDVGLAMPAQRAGARSVTFEDMTVDAAPKAWSSRGGAVTEALH